jgi:hypothetical protein
MRRKGELLKLISAQFARRAADDDEWRRQLHELVDGLDALEPPFAHYDRMRFGGPVSRDELITAPRRDYRLRPGAAKSREAAL